MKTNKKKSFLAGIPSRALALIAVFLVFIVLMTLPDKWGESGTTEVLAYIILGIVNAIICFFIVRQNPRSVWYVPLIINVLYIISSLIESMKASDWIAVCSIIALSIIASIIGALVGKRPTISGKSMFSLEWMPTLHFILRIKKHVLFQRGLTVFWFSF